MSVSIESVFPELKPHRTKIRPLCGGDEPPPTGGIDERVLFFAAVEPGKFPGHPKLIPVRRKKNIARQRRQRRKRRLELLHKIREERIVHQPGAGVDRRTAEKHDAPDLSTLGHLHRPRGRAARVAESEMRGERGPAKGDAVAVGNDAVHFDGGETMVSFGHWM